MLCCSSVCCDWPGPLMYLLITPFNLVTGNYSFCMKSLTDLYKLCPLIWKKKYFHCVLLLGPMLVKLYLVSFPYDCVTRHSWTPEPRQCCMSVRVDIFYLGQWCYLQDCQQGQHGACGFTTLAGAALLFTLHLHLLISFTARLYLQVYFSMTQTLVSCLFPLPLVCAVCGGFMTCGCARNTAERMY